MRRSTILLIAMMPILSLVACSHNSDQLSNPFLDGTQTPFGVPAFDRLKAYHFEPALERGMSLQNEEIEAICSKKEDPTFFNTIQALDQSGEMLERVSNTFFMLCDAESSDQLREVQEKMLPRLTGHENSIMMNTRLFARIKDVYDRRLSINLKDDQLRLVEKTYEKFRRAGALLDDESMTRLGEINRELATLQMQFSNNVLDQNSSYCLSLDGDQAESLSVPLRETAREEARSRGLEDGKLAFTLKANSIFPFLTGCAERELREEIFKAYQNKCNGGEWDNNQLINDIVRLRTEKAHLLGYSSYAEYVLSEQMASKPENAYELVEGLLKAAIEKSKEDQEGMMEYFREDFPQDSVKFEAWDWWYYSEKVRKGKYTLNEEMLRPFFSLENVRQGVFNLANRLYGITFRPTCVPLYNKDVDAVEVLDADDKHLAVVYFDLLSRPQKSQGAWCGYYSEQRYSSDGQTRKAPVIEIVCNFSRPSEGNPALLSIDETQTLFHEFGHALHFIFTDSRYQGLLNVEGDFVELPSQIMENWAMEPQTLRTYAVNHRSNEPIGEHLINRITRSAKFNQAFNVAELAMAALLDLDIHSQTEYQPFDVREFEKKALEKRGCPSSIEPRYHLSYFNHIFSGGYASGYYFYLWAEVLDKDAFNAFRESGDLYDRRTAQAFRREILSQGGKRDGMTMYRNFRGEDPDRDAMLLARGLIEPEVVSEEDVTDSQTGPVDER